MIGLTWIQIVISILGTAGVIVTLALTRRATDQTDRSIKLAEETAKQELRAYLDVEFERVAGIGFGAGENASGQKFTDGTHEVRHIFKLANRGQTPAREVKARIGWAILNHGAMAFTPTAFEPCNVILRDLAPGGRNTAFISNRAQHRDRLLTAYDGDERVVVWIRVEYTDVFGAPHWAHYSAILIGNPPIVERHNPGFMGGS